MDKSMYSLIIGNICIHLILIIVQFTIFSYSFISSPFLFLFFISFFPTFFSFLLQSFFHVQNCFSDFSQFFFSQLFITEAFLNSPGPIGLELTWTERIRSIFITVAVILFNYFSFQYFQDLFLIQLKLSINLLILSIIGLIIAITAGLYIYNVYIVNFAGSTSNTKKSKLHDMTKNDKKKEN